MYIQINILKKSSIPLEDTAEENCFSTNFINKLIYEIRFHENIKKVNHKEME